MKEPVVIVGTPEEMIRKLDDLILSLIAERIVLKTKFHDLPWYEKLFRKAKFVRTVEDIEGRIQRLNSLVVNITKEQIARKPQPLNMRLHYN